MKTLTIALGMLMSATFSFGQVASDFTQTDLNGTSHTLYDHLNAGKVVIVDMFATWCSPCWSFHNAHHLENLHNELGPGGTNEIVVIAYEDDVSTTLADLQGTGGNTLGNWTTGVSYNIINATAALPSEYGSGYPTISVICPADKQIKDNLFNYSSYAQMKSAVQTVINQCVTTDVETVEAESISFEVYPNPVVDVLNFNLNNIEVEKVDITDINGKLIETRSAITSNLQIDMSNWEAGIYFVQVTSTEGTQSTQKVVKK